MFLFGSIHNSVMTRDKISNIGVVLTRLSFSDTHDVTNITLRNTGNFESFLRIYIFMQNEYK